MKVFCAGIVSHVIHDYRRRSRQAHSRQAHSQTHRHGHRTTLPFNRTWLWGIATFVLVIVSGAGSLPGQPAIATLSPEPSEFPQSSQHTERSTHSVWEQSGRAALQRQDYIQAEGDFQAAIAAYEQSGQWAEAAGVAYMLSRTYVEMGDLAAAAIALDTGFRNLERLELSDRSGQSGQSSQASIPPALQAQLQAQRGQLQQADGLIEAAIDSWNLALSLYQDSGDSIGAIATQLELATAHHALGLYPQARQILTAVEEAIGTINHPELQTLNRLHVADVELALNQRDAAQRGFETAYQLAVRHQLDPIRTVLLSRLAGLAHDRGESRQAVDLFREAATLNPQHPAGIAAELGAIDAELKILNSNQGSSPAQEINVERGLQTVYEHVLTLAASQVKSQLLVSVTERIRTWATATDRWVVAPHQIATHLRDGLNDQQQAGDRRTQAQVVSALAQLYDDLDQPETAIKLTEEAIALANRVNAPEMLALYHHQLGRLLLKIQNTDEAIVAYRQAIAQLGSLEQTAALSNAERQLSFKTTVEPIYREAIGLLLKNNTDQATLQEARAILEALQLAEIENYFRENCLISQSRDVGALDPQAAIVYPIVLSDRLEILLSLPDQTMLRHTVQQSEAETLDATLSARSSLSRSLGRSEQHEALQRLHHWLIEPFSHRLEQAGIQTLVFVLDVPFRTIPMATLFDGQQYLIERYSVALAPSLQLLETSIQQKSDSFSVFIGGLEAARYGFRALPGVRDEAEMIAARVPAELRLDERFTLEDLKLALRYSSHPILHLATHGRFGSTPETTFVLAWDGKLDLTAFRGELLSRDEVRDGAIDLLILSACETAIGDQQAILGMAGFAVQSGARATIASLWGVNDQATAVQMTYLYEALARGDLNKAEALREAQLKTIARGGQYAKPFYWAPFVLIGNWL